jgi:hypothetical protein
VSEITTKPAIGSQLANIPIVMFKNELAGKEDAVRKLAVDLFSKFRQLLDRIGSEGQVSFGGEVAVVTVVHKVV